MYNLLEVINVEKQHSDKSNCDFKKVTFMAFGLIGTRKIKRPVTATRNFWPEHEVTGADGTKSIIKADAGYDGISIGDDFEGTIQSFITNAPYQIDNNMVKSFKTLVFSHEHGLTVAAKALKRYNVAPIDPETGEKFELAGTVKVSLKETPAAPVVNLNPPTPVVDQNQP